jgi:hypothetical protein
VILRTISRKKLGEEFDNELEEKLGDDLENDR